MRVVANFATFALLAAFATAQIVTSVPGCPAPSYFGICNPYVPGVFIGREGGSVPVLSTWHDGPAEKAGICAGDKIVAVNGVIATKSGWDTLVGELVSDSPSPVILRVRRGQQEFEVHVPRVRETALAALSGEKFVSAISSDISTLPDYFLRVVPEGVTLDNLKAVLNFRRRLLESAGFARVGGMEVPTATPEEQVRRLLDAKKTSQRIVGVIGLGKVPYSAGFAITVLKQPFEALVSSVVPGSPAYKAGLWVGDQLVAVDGHLAENTPLADLEGILSQPKEITLRIRRGDGIHELGMSTRPVAQLMQTVPDRSVPERPQLAKDYITGLAAIYDGVRREAMVADVFFPSPAFSAGVYPGDLITSIQNVPVVKLSREQLAEALTPANSEPLSFVLMRLGKRFVVRIVPVTYGDALRSIGRKLTKFGPAPLQCPD